MFQPCGHRVIVRRDTVENVSEGGIILNTNTTQQKLEAASCQTGVVVAIGPDAWKAFRMLDENGSEKNGKAWARPGDYVVFAKDSGRNLNDPFTPGEEDLVFLNDEDILAIIVPGEQPIPESSVKEAL